jgi:hypothetical protein
MRPQGHIFCMLAGWLVSGFACAEQWFAVIGPEAESAAVIVEVDLESVHARGHLGEAIVRVSYDQPRPHRGGSFFRSFVGSAEFDCRKRSITLISAAYFELPRAEGARLAADSSGSQSGIPESLLKSIPLPALRALLKATCALSPNP